MRLPKQMRPPNKLLASLLAVMLFLLTLWLPGRVEARNLQFIRDAEIENTIRAYATPLFQAAGLSPAGIRIFLVQDKSLNAFVAGGQNLFINTDAAGIINFCRGGSAMEDTQTSILATYALGLAAALASGEPQLGAAVISGGQDLALKGLLRYTRSQESAADQAAMTFLKATEQSPAGLLKFTERLSGKEVLLSNNQDPYLRTHPLTRDRMIFFQIQTERSPYRDKPARPEFVTMHQRMVAKLAGFMYAPTKVFRMYPKNDTSVPARYAQAIAYYRSNNLGRAIPMMDELLRESPEDPYFHELKGQMLFEHGRLEEALPAYETANRLLPNTPSLLLPLTRVQIGLNQPQLDEAALKNLEILLRKEPNNSFAWRLAATAYGRQGNEAMTALALAESALAAGQYQKALTLGGRAEELLETGSPGWLKAQDLQNVARREVKK